MSKNAWEMMPEEFAKTLTVRDNGKPLNLCISDQAYVRVQHKRTIRRALMNCQAVPIQVLIATGLIEVKGLPEDLMGYAELKVSALGQAKLGPKTRRADR